MIPTGYAQTQYPTLADALNSTINNVNWGAADSWTSTWGIILGGQSLSAFDNAISQDIASGNYNDALFVARLAQISGYSSQAISSGTLTALTNMPMAGSLPDNFNAKSYGDPNSGCYLVYDRYLIWAYQYAQQDGLTSKWNANQAFLDFSTLYNKPPINSHSGEMLFADPAGNWAYSYSSRYYDEYAETLSVFVQLAEIGVPGALAYADKAWTGLQTLWNGKYYVYDASWPIIECESGNFAQVIAEYMQLKGGSIPYWNRVLEDLDYKLLVNGWNSPGWSTTGVIVHGANGANPEQRLWETMGAMTALEALYPYFNSTMQASFDNMMLGSSKAWQGLMSSSLNVGGYFKGASDDSSTSNDATTCAAATLFLDGIVPVTGSLAIPLRNEEYQDSRTSFPVTEFQFNSANREITIPVNAGELTFIYGSSPVSYNFPANGNYTIQFSSDWNTITSVNGQPVTSAPSAPQNLLAFAGNIQISLSWSAPLTNGNSPITGYNVYRSTSSGAETFLASAGTATNYIDASVTNGLTYYYAVTAVNAVGESARSNEASATPSAPASVLVVSGFPNPVTAGTSQSFTVMAKDANGNVATGYVGTVHFTSSDSQAVLPANYAFVAADKGVHVFSATLKTVGTQSITATDTVTPSITGTQSGITVNVAVKSLSITITTSRSSYSRGSSVPITVMVKDASSGALLQGASVTVNVLSPSGSTVATFTGKTGLNGQAKFTYTLARSAARGTWTATTTVTLTGYQNGAGQTKFTVS
jgi:fibronectin type 3 domain-containing protein